MSTVTLIVYRKNSALCSLGYLQENHDSELKVYTFNGVDLDQHLRTENLSTQLEMVLLDDMRLLNEKPWVERAEIRFLLDGETPQCAYHHQLDWIKREAEDVATEMFDREQEAKRRAEERERQERAEWRAREQRHKDMIEMKRILNTYSVDELRNEIANFRI